MKEKEKEEKRGRQGGGVHTCLGVYRVLQVKGDVNDGPDHFISVSLRGILQTLLYYITCKFVLGEVKEICLHLSNEYSSIGFPAMLHHKLNDVVAVAVLLVLS